MSKKKELNFCFVLEIEIDNNEEEYTYSLTTTMVQQRPLQTEFTSQQFRNQLIESITNDKTLVEIISDSIFHSYTIDTVRLLCAVVEKSFDNNLEQCQKTIDFITRWLSLTDGNDAESLDMAQHPSIWSLAHVYTFIEYDQHDLLSLYSICRIMDKLDPSQSFYDDLLGDDQSTRSTVREKLFQIMFDSLWKNLCESCSSDQSIDSWIHSYTFISKYYPSDKVLQHMQQMRVKGRIEFMNLAYLIFLNETTPQPKDLVYQLLQHTKLMQDDIDGRMFNYGSSVCLKLLPDIIKTIVQYLTHVNAVKSTVMIDIQQWILSTLKSSNQSCEAEIKELFRFLNDDNNQLSLAMKQFLFDELMQILFQIQRQNRPGANKQKGDVWDRICLLPILSSCITNLDVQEYCLPTHPSIGIDDNQRHPLFDLFFFHLKRIASEDMINPQLINKILISNPPTIKDRSVAPVVGEIYKKLKEYFLIELTALLFCEKDLNNLDQQQINNALNKVINQYLTVNPQSVALSDHVQHFLATIITKRSWNYLLTLLKSDRFQLLNAQWSNALYALIEIKQNTPRNKYLQLCHQIQFTLSVNNTYSIFPQLHQPYDELSKLIDQCAQAIDQPERWKPFTDWIQLKLNANPVIVNFTQIKVMLLLHTYYNYYCNNQLRSLDGLLQLIEISLQPLPEELRVFRAFLEPEQNLVGYDVQNNDPDQNQLNHLFQLGCADDNELNTRHLLVNLLAMILLGGKQNFLWTFTFEPLKLEKTFGKYT